MGKEPASVFVSLEGLRLAMTCFVFAIGLLFGSFLNVVAYRVPRGESIVYPGSHCPNCQHQLRAWELVPVLSWSLLGGHCRTCGAQISVRYPVLELLTASLCTATFLQVPSWPMRVTWWLFWFVLVTVVGTDITAMKVPNVISYPSAVMLTLLSIITGVQTWPMALAGLVVGYGTLLVIHVLSRGNMGLGDAKLYISIGAMLGPWMCLESFVLACCFGSVVGLAMRVCGLLGRRQYLAFVPYIACGVIVTVFYGQALLHWYEQYLLIH